MQIDDRIAGIIAGLLFFYIGVDIISEEFPRVGMRFGFTAPVVHWVGWPCIFFGVAAFITNIYGLFTYRKKRLAAIARCKARHEQEAETAKAEDNQHS